MNTTNLLLSAIVVLLILVIEQWWRGRRGRKLTSKSSAPHIERFVTPSASVAVPAEVPSVVSTASEFAPAPFPLKRENSKDLLKDRVRERKAAGVDLISLVPAVKSEFGDRVTMDDIFEAVADVGYPPTDIATVMVSNGYQLSEVVTLLNQNTDLGPGDLATIIMPLAEGPTVAKRAEDVIGTVVDELSIDDNDDELFELPGQLGCTPEEAAAILFRKTGLGLADVLVRLKLCGSPVVVAGIAKELDVDLSDDDEYKVFRDDGNLEFGDTAAILKACEKNAEDIITAENSYNQFSTDGADLGDIFPVLSAIGFTNAEIMEGIIKADFIAENEDGTIVMKALDRDVPMAEILSFLRGEEVDPDTLDEEMRELDVDIHSRIDVLHALLHAGGEPVAEES